MYKEVGISSNNVPITLSIWYTERSSPTIVFLPGTMSHLSLIHIQQRPELSAYGDCGYWYLLRV